MALAGNPRVSKSTRERVADAAEQMKYRPDPALRSLARYRHSLGEPNYHATIGWVHNQDSPYWWHKSAVYRVLYDSAQKRAQRLGYQLDDIWINRRDISQKRATEMLRSRGIRGILLLPTFGTAPKIELEWSHFAVVRITDYLQGHHLMHLVGADHYAAMNDVLARVKKLCYQRPGLLTSLRLEQCLFAQYSSAYLAVKNSMPESRWPGIFFCDNFSESALLQWLKREKPDVIIMAYVAQSLKAVLQTLAKHSFRVPEDVGIVMLCLPDRTYQEDLPDFSGIDEGFQYIGERAVDLLVGLCENFEFGLPQKPIRHLIGGIWHDGDTLRVKRTSSRARRKKTLSKKINPHVKAG